MSTGTLRGLFARDRLGPVAAAVGAALLVNGLLALAGVEGGETDPSPPGWLVGTVWTLIFAGFGASYAALVRAGVPTRGERAALVLLGLVCLAYPAYTGGFEDRAVALGGTVATALFAAALVAWFWRVDRTASLLVAPALAWLVFALYMLA